VASSRARRLFVVAVPIVLLAVGLGVALWPGGSEGDAAARRPARTRHLPPERPSADEPAFDPEPEPVEPVLLEGRVEDGSRRRIAAARVVLRPVHEGDPEVATTSAADGSFRFDVPDDGTYFALAEHPRHVPGGIAGPFSVREGRVPEGPVVIVLGSAAALSARVVDPAGNPVAGARVELQGEPAPAVDTDTRGEASWTALRPAGHVSVMARAAGFAEARATTRLVAGETAEVVLAMEAGRELRGRVVDPSRRSVAAATVRVLADPHRLGSTTATVTTDEAGEFVLVDLPETSVVLVATHDDFAASEGVVAEAGVRFVEVPLRAPASLSGWVRTRTGSRVPGADIVLLDAGEDQPGTRADDRGEFSYTKLPPGHYVVVARAEGEAGRTEVTLAAGEEARGVEVLVGGTFTVTGVVVGRGTGDPVPAARVWPRTARVGGAGRRPSTLTDEEGHFVLEGLTLDVTELDVRAPGFRAEDFPLTPTGDDIDVGTLTLEPRVFGGVGLGLRVADGGVHVTGAYDGTPAARAGLAEGDTILEIDGERVDGLSLEDVVGKIRGSEGSEVRLRVARPGEAEPFVVDLTRETIDPDKLDRPRREH